MILDLAIVGAASIITLLATALIALKLTNNSFIKLVIQFLGMGGLAYGLYTIGMIGVIGSIIIAIVPITSRVFGYLFVKWFTHRALSGNLGKESQWAAELIKNGDREFAMATQIVPQPQLREISIIAESKEELRELTIERAEEFQ